LGNRTCGQMERKGNQTKDKEGHDFPVVKCIIHLANKLTEIITFKYMLALLDKIMKGGRIS
jgi:hypothetical protein